jgi:hypothetical protein
LQLDELEFNKSNIIYSNYYLFNEEKKYKKLFSKTHLPSGYITEKLLKKYVIAMSSVMISSLGPTSEASTPQSELATHIN